MTQATETFILICEHCGGKGAVADDRRSHNDGYGPAVTCRCCEGSGMVVKKISYAPHHPIRITP